MKVAYLINKNTLYSLNWSVFPNNAKKNIQIRRSVDIDILILIKGDIVLSDTCAVYTSFNGIRTFFFDTHDF